MPRVRPIIITSTTLTAATLAMWGVAVGLTVTRREPGVMALDRAAATSATVLAGVCWLLLWHMRYVRIRHDCDRTTLIRTLARTVPLPRLDR